MTVQNTLDTEGVDGACGVTRRRVVESAILGSAGLLAGCSGSPAESSASGSSPSGGQSELTFISGPSDSLAFGMGNAMSAVIRDNSDLTLNIKSGPSGQSVSLVGRGEADLSFSTTLVGMRAMNNEGPFENIDFSQKLLQLPSFYFLRLGGFADVSTDIEYFGDLSGKSFAPGPSGASYWNVWKLALQKSLNMNELEVQNSSVGQLSDVFSSSRATAVGGPTLSNNVTPGFMQQVLSQNDVRMLSYRDEVLQTLREDVRTPVVEIAKDAIPNVAEYTASGDTTPMVSANYVLWSSDAVASETVYTLFKNIWENKKALSETHAAYKLWEAKEWYTKNMTPEIPVHPGAVKFLKEIGVWDDTFTEGSI